jgi:hypothetical protein
MAGVAAAICTLMSARRAKTSGAGDHWPFGRSMAVTHMLSRGYGGPGDALSLLN